MKLQIVTATMAALGLFCIGCHETDGRKQDESKASPIVVSPATSEREQRDTAVKADQRQVGAATRRRHKIDGEDAVEGAVAALLDSECKGGVPPKNLKQAMHALEEALRTEGGLQEFRKADSTIGFHHGLGTHIRNCWQLWGGANPRLRQWFRQRGIRHPDRMSSVIMESLHQRLHGEKVNALE
jgi:hypothetical protein